MDGVNLQILIGNLGKDPEVKQTSGNKTVAKFSVGTTSSWINQAGGRQEKTNWHNVVAWGKQAENVGKYLSKGSKVYVEGRTETRSYEGKDGEKKYITEVVATVVNFLDQKPATKTDKPRKEVEFEEYPNQDEEELPF